MTQVTEKYYKGYPVSDLTAAKISLMKNEKMTEKEVFAAFDFMVQYDKFFSDMRVQFGLEFTLGQIHWQNKQLDK